MTISISSKISKVDEMFNVRGPENFVLTFQSVPPFFVENLLALALAILMAVPLISRIQRFLENRNNDQSHSATRELNRRYRHDYDQYRPIRTIRSSPDFNRDKFWIIESNNQMSRNDENYDSDTDKSLDEFDIYDYDLYRYKLIEENLTKQYGPRQAPGDVVFNSLHLSSIDSNTGIKLNKRYEHSFFDYVENSYKTMDKDKNSKIKLIHPRDYFLTKAINEKPETADKATEATVSIVEVDQVPEMISFKERLKTPSGVPRRQKVSKVPADNKINKFSSDNEFFKKKIDLELHSRPSSPIKEIKKIVNDSKISEKVLKIKQALKKDPSTQGTISVSSELNKKISHSRKSLESKEIKSNKDKSELKISQDKIECKSILNKSKNEENSIEKLTGEDKSADGGEVELKNSNVKSQIMKIKGPDDKVESSENTNEISTTLVSPEVEKCPSVTSNDVFSSYSCSLRIPGRRSRPSTASGAPTKAFKHLMPKVNSRPRSSGGSFAWEVPDNSGKIWSVENRKEPKAAPTIRPKSANPAISRKKSEAALSVLESIIDLTYDMTIDIQDSFATMGVDEIKERLEERELPLELKRSTNHSKEERNLKLNLKTMKKSKIASLMSSAKRIKPISKISSSVTNQPITSEQKKPYLQARSGNYSMLQMAAMRKNRSNY